MIKLKKIASLSLSLAIILLTFPATAILASWNSQPDSLLYPIKRGLEKTAIALTPESLLKTKLHFAFLDRRATEASVALIQQSSNQQVLDDIVTEAKAEREGKEPDRSAPDEMYNSIVSQIDGESTALYATARLWDDGIIDPRDSRKVLGYALSICGEAEQRPLRANTFGVARG